MGFGSYDESEQKDQNVDADADDSDGINIHESEHDGEVNFESELSTDDLVDRLDDMK